MGFAEVRGGAAQAICEIVGVPTAVATGDGGSSWDFLEVRSHEVVKLPCGSLAFGQDREFSFGGLTHQELVLGGLSIAGLQVDDREERDGSIERDDENVPR
jgi:hypothetical protein